MFKRHLFILFLIVLLGCPQAEAAEVVIDSDVSPSYREYRKNMVVFVSDQVGYVFYTDSNRDMVYKKTLDGGETWGTKVLVHNFATDSCGPIIWYDKWTPGNTGNLVHIIDADRVGDNMFYVEFDTSTDTFSAAIDISGYNRGSISHRNRYYVTRATDGALYAAMIDNEVSEQGKYLLKCSSSCTDNDNWSDVTTPPFDWDNDGDIILMPLAGGNILGINQANGTKGVFWAIYTAATNSWSSKTKLLDTRQNDNYPSPWGATVDPVSNDVYFIVHTRPFHASATQPFYIFDGATWTSKSQFDGSNVQVPSNALAIDTSAGEAVGVALDKDSSIGEIYDRRFEGASWTPHNYSGTVLNDNYKAISINLVNQERLYAVWFNDSDNDLMGITITDIVPANDEQNAPFFFGSP